MDSPQNIYNDPVVFKVRKGTPEDPRKRITESPMIVGAKAQLREVPERFDEVEVTGEGIDWFEILDGNVEEIPENGYIVNYVEGLVYFNAIHDKKQLTYNYTGTGAHYFPDSRIYLTKDNKFPSLSDKLKDVDRLSEEQKSRVDELIRSVPQPSEVVDQRIDRNGKVFNTAKDRLDSNQENVENAQVDLNGREYPSLKGRIDANQKEVEDAMDDGKGTTYPSLKDRINDFDSRISGFEENIESVEGRLTLKVDSEDFNGEKLIALIELTPEGVMISGKRIDLTGQITINDLDDETYAKVSEAISAANLNLEGSLPTSVKMDENGITAYTSDPSKFARMNQDGFYAKGGAFTIERPDGAKLIDNGIASFEYNVQPAYPPFMEAPIELDGIYCKTTSETWASANFYSFRHTGRYLKLNLAHKVSDSGVIGKLRLRRGSETSNYYETTFSNSTPFYGEELKITIDLGTPTMAEHQFYLQMSKSGIEGAAYLRVVKIWQDG
ncbi:hypothetical protein [Cytobacillus gottheilii]|uniref:hypothetical protein n=1 Tax=Cytobacillus gottheilii TaxID=859144 RepID=UPI0009BC3BA8|nr:hypothetical protein [Cytobacillus gottheilii]